MAMGKKCVSIILGVLWLPAFLLFLLNVFFAGFNQMSDMALTDEIKAKMEGKNMVAVPSKTEVKDMTSAGKEIPVSLEEGDPIEVPDTFPKWILDGVKLEVEVTWNENVWVGIVTKAEKEAKGCGLIKRPMDKHKNCVKGDMTYSGGGPDTASTKSFKMEVEPGTWYIVGSAPPDGGKNGQGKIEVTWRAEASVMTGVQVICSLACVVLGVFLISPCILCCCCKGKKDG